MLGSGKSEVNSNLPVYTYPVFIVLFAQLLFTLEAAVLVVAAKVALSLFE